MRATVGSFKRSTQMNIGLASIENDPGLDYRALGKSTRCNIDHSSFHCILPYTSVK